MTERRILGELDFDYGANDPADDGWYGSEQVDAAPSAAHDTTEWLQQADIAEPVATPELDDPPGGYPRYPAEYDPEDPDPEPEETPSNGALASRNGRPAVPPTRSWESQLANSGAWDFKVSTAGPWYRSKRVLAAAAAVAGVVLVATGVILFTRDSGAAVDESTPVPPSTPTTAGPAPSSPAPALSTAVAPPPPPVPPPPPPSADQITVAPTRGYTPPRRSAPSPSDMPEIGVTRTPVTRAPFSATPPPPRAPDRNSATPGDGPRGGWGRW
ncbi:MAG: hypothetical protein JWP55_5329 [Mycobacterium sp.]|nr:hypothetical protein [Mycobacterium sp.]